MKKELQNKVTTQLLAGFVFSTLTAPIFANTSIEKLKQGDFLLQLGGYWRTEASSQFIHINELIGDRFVINNNGANNNGLFGVGYFIDGLNKNKFDIHYGINWFYLPKTQVTGTVFQENLFENLAYAYNVTHYPLYIAAKSVFNTSSFTDKHLTMNIGIGPNFMTTSKLQEHSISGPDVTTIPDQIFSGKTTTVFSATVGAGIQLDHFFGKVPLECGYQFFYLGQGGLAITNDQVQNTLKTGTLYANAVMCSITI